MTAPEALKSTTIAVEVAERMAGDDPLSVFGWATLHPVIKATLEVLVEKGYLGNACVECETPLAHHSETLCDGCEMEAFGESG